MKNESLIVKTAKETLDVEIQALMQLKDCINQDFIAVVQAIANSSGRLIVTGVGKSALIAQKIVATLNSTGTPALFLHAADAIHGDLGMVQPADLILCLSKSGETAEIKVLVPLVQSLGNQLIAMVSNPASFLGKKANYILHTPIEKEADPNNLAPTASTTAQVALGDALATSLLALKGFTPKDFAQYHPGGALGKRLYLRVSDLFPNNEQPKVLATDNLRTTILEMTSKRLGATAVVSEGNQLLGIITDGDLRRMLEKTANTAHIRAKDLMTAGPQFIDPDAMAFQALDQMRENSITQLIVADQSGQYLGFIHLHDLIREGLI